MLADIRKAKATITFAQDLYQDGSIARDLATAFAEQCRAGVKVDILLDSKDRVTHGLTLSKL